MKLWIRVVTMAVALGSLPRARAGDFGPPAISVGGAYYQNSDHARRHDEGLDAVIPLSLRALTIEAASRWGHDPRGNAASQQVLFGVNDDSFSPWTLRGRGGAVRFDSGAKPAGMLDILGKADAGEVRLRAEYTPLFETADMIRNEIMFAGIELGGKAALSRRFNPAARLFLRDYSDNNDSVKARGDLPWAVTLSPVRWEFGYRQEYAAFRRQSNGGYFDPDALHSFQAVSSASYWREQAEAYAEVFGGLQQSRRSGNRSTDGFFGVYAEAVLRKLGAFEVALTAEADDYSLGSASGFRHLQIGVRLTSRA